MSRATEHTYEDRGITVRIRYRSDRAPGEAEVDVKIVGGMEAKSMSLTGAQAGWLRDMLTVALAPPPGPEKGEAK